MPKPISFVRGFRVPTQEDIDEALGTNNLFSNDFKNSFNSLPKPTSDLDWLTNYKEQGYGQSNDRYNVSLNVFKNQIKSNRDSFLENIHLHQLHQFHVFLCHQVKLIVLNEQVLLA
jgi:hypothetical protein